MSQFVSLTFRIVYLPDWVLGTSTGISSTMKSSKPDFRVPLIPGVSVMYPEIPAAISLFNSLAVIFNHSVEVIPLHWDHAYL